MARSRLWIVAAAMIVVGCSDDGGKAPEDRGHVWEEQVETMNKARDVERTLEEADQRRRREINQDAP